MIILENIFLNYPISDKNLSLRRNIIKGIFGSNIKKNYIEALKKINLKLDKGVFGIYGENGTGKTSLLKIVAGIYQPSSGKIEINGSVCSMININFGFNQELTGIENIELRLIVEGIKKDHRKNLIDIIKTETELGEYLYLPIKTYSTGMKFRLAFFTSLFIESDILLLDEWIGTADQKLRDKVDKLILERITKSKITLIASHNLDRLKKICNKIIYFEKGEILKII
tara:strand:- start:1183 stop:1863 length:681 start_codon:yes stop_codon:yes gene_type:complete